MAQDMEQLYRRHYQTVYRYALRLTGSEHAAEELAAETFYRAVAQLNILCELALPLVKVGGQFLAMKSVDSDQEVQSAKSAIAQLGGKIGKIWDYTIPGTDIRHRVVIIQKQHPTPAAYPRPFARIKKAHRKCSARLVSSWGTTLSPRLCSGSISSSSFRWKVQVALGERNGAKYLSAGAKYRMWARRKA